MTVRLLVLAGVAVAASLLAVALRDGGDRAVAPREPAAEPAPLEACSDAPASEIRGCYARELAALVGASDRPADAVEEVARAAYAEPGGYLLGNCHGLMHTVGRERALERSLGLADLVDVLPASNDPACAAGFSHGVVSGVAPTLDARDPRGAEAVCADAETRFQRYSCTHGFGHAFMRLNEGRLEPALGLCRRLGPRAAPDCAQGAFHDYWFAVLGIDEAETPGRPVTDPRRLCAGRPAAFVRPCWYRAFLDGLEPGTRVESAAEIDALCAGLRALQRQGCITAAAVLGPADPAEQLALCGGFTGVDAESCIRATKVQNILQYSPDLALPLVRECRRFPFRTALACYRILGKALAVVTDGAFGRDGCPRLDPAAARRACRAGAARMEEALVTFS